MKKNLYDNDALAVSFDLSALAKDQLQLMADIASGRLTPAEGRARAGEGRKALKAAETILKLRQMAQRSDKGTA
jgi:hypothetical protein